MTWSLVTYITPSSLQVKFALEEVGAKYDIYKVPILPAPAFYREKINPVGKVRTKYQLRRGQGIRETSWTENTQRIHSVLTHMRQLRRWQLG